LFWRLQGCFSADWRETLATHIVSALVNTALAACQILLLVFDRFTVPRVLLLFAFGVFGLCHWYALARRVHPELMMPRRLRPAPTAAKAADEHDAGGAGFPAAAPGLETMVIDVTPGFETPQDSLPDPH
jgi:hypothetical protein